jgi:hypothetical protein
MTEMEIQTVQILTVMAIHQVQGGHVLIPTKLKPTAGMQLITTVTLKEQTV